MIRADFGPGTDYGFHDKNGKAHDGYLNLGRLPFWIYARYSAGGCTYVLIDGLRPKLYDDLPATGDVPVFRSDANGAVIRNCGDGFEVVSREGYVSLFDGPFHSPYLDRDIADAVGQGLARDYARCLVQAYGGKAALQKRLNAAADFRPGAITGAFASALVAQGIRLPK